MEEFHPLDQHMPYHVLNKVKQLCGEGGLKQKPSLPGKKLSAQTCLQSLASRVKDVLSHSRSPGQNPQLPACTLSPVVPCLQPSWVCLCQAGVWIWTRVSHPVHRIQIGFPPVATLLPPIGYPLRFFSLLTHFCLISPLLSLDYSSTQSSTHQGFPSPNWAPGTMPSSLLVQWMRLKRLEVNLTFWGKKRTRKQ